MSITKYREKFKVVSIILIIAFAFSMVYAGWNFVRTSIFHESRTVAIEVNGEKIYKVDFDRDYQNIKAQIEQQTAQKKAQLSQAGVDVSNFKSIPEDVIKEAVLKSMIDQQVLKTSAKELKIKVSDGDVNKQVEAYQKQYGGKNQFIQALTANGLNLTTFKDRIKSGMILEKVQEKVESSLKLSDEELKKVYNRYKYTYFEDQKFEEVKPQLVETLNKENGEMLLSSFLNKQYEKAKIIIKDADLKKSYDHMRSVVVEKEGYSFKRESLNDKIIRTFASLETGYSDQTVEKIIESMKTDLDKLLAIAKKAKEVGIKASPEFVGIDELNDYSKKYYNYLVDTYKPEESAMKAKFEANRQDYNVKNSISGQVVGDEFVAKSRDWDNAKKKAEEIKKTLTLQNFAEIAKKTSDDPSRDNGGLLGETVDLSRLVQEFADAVKKGEKGKIVGPVKTQFGEHLIYIQDKNINGNENLAKVSHILITPKISEETKKEIIKSLQDLKSEIVSKRITFEQVNTQEKYKFSVKEQFKKLTKQDPIPGVGEHNTELLDKLFASKNGDILEYQSANGFFLLQKTSEIPFREVTFEEVKERIRLELAFVYADTELDKIK